LNDERPPALVSFSANPVTKGSLALAVVFFSYSHKDEALRDRLETHLAMLKRQGVIETWHDRRIQAGDEFAGKISEELERADLILLLVSSDFLASDYCYDVEMQRAIERHEASDARVIPIILRPCDWHGAPFGRLQALPKDGRPVVSWPDLDEAFLDITRGIRAALATERHAVRVAKPAEAAHVASAPRSSNLRLRKEFSDADRDQFLEEAFEYMAAFFENSLNELEGRNSQIQSTFRLVDANRFNCTVYKNGKEISQCRVSLGGPLGKGIFYAEGEDRGTSSFNESLSVEADDQGLFLRPLGMGRFDNTKETHLTFEGAADYYWSRLIERLQ
jgi:hypothetical protein